MAPEDVAALVAGLPRRIHGTIEHWAQASPGATALIDKRGSWTYAAFSTAIAEAAGILRARGVRAGDRVLIACENYREAVALLFAASQLDAWPVPVDGRLAPREIAAIRDHCDPALIAVAMGKSPAGATLARMFEAVPVALEHGASCYMSAGNPGVAQEPVFEDPARQVAAMLYTSGSTGRPKGVMLTHRGILYVAAASGKIRNLAARDKLYGVMPLSHSVGLTSVLLSALMHGASVMLTPRFNPADMVRAVQEEGLSVLLGTPALFSLLEEYAASKGMRKIGSPTLRIISASGSPLDMRVKAATEALFGLPLHHGYGATECSPTIAQVRPESPCDDLSVGPLLPGMEARFRNVVDGVGELELRGPNLMLGYYRSLAETSAVLDKQGWFSTGDLAALKNDNLYVLGRCKDIIIRNGFNVYPAEIEAVLNAHPGVLHSAVTGRPMKMGATNGDEEITAHVQQRENVSLTESALLQFAAKELASYKLPSHVEFVASMPMLPSGKVDKKALI